MGAGETDANGVRVSDYAAPLPAEAAEGEVRGVFAHGLDVVRADGRLLYLGGYDRPLSCTGAQLPAGALARLLACARPGDVAWFGDGAVTVRGSGGGSAARVRVDFARARVADTRVRAVLDGAAAARLGAAVEAAGPAGSCGLARDDALDRALAGLAEGVAGEETVAGGEAGERDADTASPDALVPAVRWLYGRGSGLTPAGDDVLCGFGAGLLALGRGPAHARLVAAVRAVARTRRTTYVSEAYLGAMAAGRANEPFCRLLAAARAGEPLEPALDAVRGLGHTSGSDLLLGLGLALGGGCPGVPARFDCPH